MVVLENIYCPYFSGGRVEALHLALAAPELERLGPGIGFGLAGRVGVVRRLDLLETDELAAGFCQSIEPVIGHFSPTSPPLVPGETRYLSHKTPPKRLNRIKFRRIGAKKAGPANAEPARQPSRKGA